MGLKLNAAIDTARGILNDRDASGYRYSPEDLLKYANDALDALCEVAPQFFHTDGELECTPNAVLQQVPYDNALALVNIIGIKNGPAITPVDRRILDQFHPGWMTDPAGPAKHFIPIPDEPMRFMVCPKAPAGQKLNIIYVKVPESYAADQDTGLPTTLESAVVDYIVGRAESRNDESVNTNRAAQAMANFYGRFRKVTPPNGGQNVQGSE